MWLRISQAFIFERKKALVTSVHQRWAVRHQGNYNYTCNFWIKYNLSFRLEIFTSQHWSVLMVLLTSMWLAVCVCPESWSDPFPWVLIGSFNPNLNQSASFLSPVSAVTRLYHLPGHEKIPPSRGVLWSNQDFHRQQDCWGRDPSGGIKHLEQQTAWRVKRADDRCGNWETVTE